MYAKSGGKIGHVVFEAGVENVVAPRTIRPIPLPGIPADAVKAQQTHPPRQFGILRGEHAAFPGADVFRGIEAETGHVAERAYLAAKVSGSESMRGIFDYRHAELAGTFANPVHVAWMARIMHRNNSPNPLVRLLCPQGAIARIPSALLLNEGDEFVGIEVVGVRIDVYENRLSALMNDHIGSCSKGQGAGNNGVSRAHPNCSQCQVQGGST